jgi:hypothetical protein
LLIAAETLYYFFLRFSSFLLGLTEAFFTILGAFEGTLLFLGGLK